MAAKDQIPSAISIKSSHNTDTAMQFVLAKIEAVEKQAASDNMRVRDKLEQIIAERDRQAIEYERRLDALNHEAARINSANASNVSREVYDSFIISNDDWKRRIELQVAASVPQSEYRAYKESANTATALQAGSREGIKLTGSTMLAAVLAISGLVGIVVGVQSYMAGRAQQQTAPPPQIIYVQPTQTPTTTTITKP